MTAIVRQFAPYALAVLLLPVLKCTYDGRRRAEGAEQVAVKAREKAEGELAIAKRRVDTTYRTDTIRLTRTLVRRDTVLATVKEYIDREVPVPVEVVRDVLRADSTAIAACLVTVLTCEQRVAVRDSTISLLMTDRDYWKGEARPSLWTQVKQVPGRVGSHAIVTGLTLLIFLKLGG